MPNRTAFLSHKVKDAKLAKQVQLALVKLFPAVTIFLSEEIRKGGNFRNDISKALAESRFFILLYTDPNEDWSWCFYEVGSYRSQLRLSDEKNRPFYCLHSGDFPPPSPVADLQAVKASIGDIEQWIRDLSVVLKHRAPPATKIAAAARKIELAIKASSVFLEQVLKPYIWITPPWPGPHTPNWHAAELPPIALENSRVTIDHESATKLHLSELPEKCDLLQFLKRLNGEISGYRSRKPYWMERFFESLTMALDGNLDLKEVAYFRNLKGGIYRPVVVSVAKSKDGANAKLRVVFAHAYSAPLTDHPTAVQRLADGVRLGVRTRIEVIEEYSGSMAHKWNAKPANEPARNHHVGSKMIEALQAITEEAKANGMRLDQATPKLFTKATKQAEYKRLREKGISLLHKLEDVADSEDAAGTGEYIETEKLLLELKEVNEQYLKLAVPQLDAFLRSSE